MKVNLKGMPNFKKCKRRDKQDNDSNVIVVTDGI